ncbi:MAG: hypothetical protein AB1454_13760 [Candidatus Auribacterota bacterium]
MINPEYKKNLLTLHTSPKDGSPYWIDFFQRNHLDIDEIIEDPLSIPPMDINVLRQYPLEYFIPRAVLESNRYLITGETSGFTGKPVITAYTEQEFHNGFIQPFLDSAQSRGFPVKSRWLWAGPTGPHIIGKAVRAILKYVNGLDPFSIDFDPRWYRKLPEDSLSRKRYMAHIHDQIMDIINLQRIDVIFSTPPVIAMLCEEMSQSAREQIRGIHYGGVGMSPEEYDGFHKSFPNAVHISGYGNSLAGVFIEESFDSDGIEYNTVSDRIEIRIVNESPDGLAPCSIGERGRVMISRYDESFLILNMLERDWAVRTSIGLKNPGPRDTIKLQKVLY